MKSDYRLVKAIHTTRDGEPSTQYSVHKTYYHTDGEYHRHDNTALLTAGSVEELQDILKGMLAGSEKSVVHEYATISRDRKEMTENSKKINGKVKRRTIEMFRLANSYNGDKDYSMIPRELEKFAAKDKKDVIDYTLDVLQSHIHQLRFEAHKAKKEKPLTGIEVMADYGGHGLWRRDGKFLGCPVKPEELGDAEFVTYYRKWISDYNKNGTFDWDFMAYNIKGVQLAKMVKLNHPSLRVTYHPVGRNDKYFDRILIT
jgi:hypothetical protein